ncbi:MULTISPECIES: flavin prenyltransferase UbiX [unclassified Neptuniibacter]|uniref:flavin prenyltransferase UbiX n=1 Tax=unclassified Neptuniibacter TaxID=2630693 RepID=UPI000C354797|nr:MULTISPECIES: flavin prenyltransferase UbiX [unclassified Neptuniibacter]MAY41598.1 aromatic acid decarboxylase [Oceanospirillaceae bacterium]|tara:strand:+ start:11708 stop:12331 length:624 start_codon:yes stop_codon:yes gene_type:complete
MSNLTEETITLAITGASGAQYGLRLLQCLLQADKRVFVMISRAAQVVINTETDLKMPGTPSDQELFLSQLYDAKPDQLKVFGREQWMAPVASGSGAPSKMVVCPCSTGSLSAIAAGASNNLIERAADVALKERRQLIMVPREAPYSEIHLEHMLKLTRMGVVMIPASPGFYNRPESVEDMIDFVVARILNQLGIEQQLLPRWGEGLI